MLIIGPHAHPAEAGTAARAGLSAAELAIARSVLYASLFDYPLTLAQLRQTLIESAADPFRDSSRPTGGARPCRP